MYEHNYEIYTCCPKTGETGWDIKHVSVISKTDRSYDARKFLTNFPHYDCVILSNYSVPSKYNYSEGTAFEVDQYTNKRIYSKNELRQLKLENI